MEKAAKLGVLIDIQYRCLLVQNCLPKNLPLLRQKGKTNGSKPESSKATEAEEGAEEPTNSDITSQSMATAGGFVLIEEPVEPKPIDNINIRDEVLDKMLSCLRPPGEPKLKLSLKESEKGEDDPKDIR